MSRGLAVLLAALVLVACGVPTEEGAQIREPDDVPFGLLDDERDRQAAPAPGGSAVVRLYLWDDESEALTAVDRRVDSTALRSVLAELDGEPTRLEASAGLRNPLAGAGVVSDAEVSGGVASIDLAESFADISGSDQLVSIAQLVFTSTARPGVGQVTFTVEGDEVDILRGDGSVTSGSVTREDYQDLTEG